MRLALNDMRALNALTPDVLAQREALLSSAGVVALDTNLPAETLVWLANTCSAPLLVDPVSTAKALRIATVLPQIHALKLNVLEAGALLDTTITAEDEDACRVAASDLVAAGVTCVFLTRGSDGVVAADADEVVSLPAPRVAIANVTGAGDAFSAGVAYSTLLGLSLSQSARIGSAMAALALASSRTVSTDICLDALPAFAKES
jgi:pseudouridine kinase